MKENISIQSDTWRRLKKNRGAVFGMIIIAICPVDGGHFPICWPLITVRMPTGWSWKSADKNQVTIRSFLLIKKQQDVHRGSFLQRLFSGEDDRYDWIPISSWQQQGDSLVVQKFIDEGYQ